MSIVLRPLLAVRFLLADLRRVKVPSELEAVISASRKGYDGEETTKFTNASVASRVLRSSLFAWECFLVGWVWTTVNRDSFGGMVADSVCMMHHCCVDMPGII
jgi:hypothetical protein